MRVSSGPEVNKLTLLGANLIAVSISILEVNRANWLGKLKFPKDMSHSGHADALRLE